MSVPDRVATGIRVVDERRAGRRNRFSHEPGHQVVRVDGGIRREVAAARPGGRGVPTRVS